jgi:tRNA dimethylallyltransferase
LSSAQLQALKASGIAATRQLAKRQLTWLRSMPARRSIACDAPDAQDQLLRQVAALWERA